jgi:hypothetical protein
MPLPVLAAILGYNNLRSVMKYVHVQSADIDREMLRMEQAPSGAGPVTSDENTDSEVNSGEVKNDVGLGQSLKN